MTILQAIDILDDTEKSNMISEITKAQKIGAAALQLLVEMSLVETQDDPPIITMERAEETLRTMIFRALKPETLKYLGKRGETEWQTRY